MNEIHKSLKSIDLNLLLVFEALFRLRSVTTAADELAMSASAFSHALARLRQSMGDVLFVRKNNGMDPTVRAIQMADAVTMALKLLSSELSKPTRFDPATSEQLFVLSATDYTAFAVLPPFIARLQHMAPHVRIKVVYAEQKIALGDLAVGRIDFCLGYSSGEDTLATGIDAVDWFTDDYVVIASRNHPTIQHEITLAQYLDAKHVVVTPWNEPRGEMDYLLDAMALQRKVAIQLPTVLAAPFIIANTALVMTLPRHAAQTLQYAAPIAIYPAPFPIPPYTVKVYGHVNYAQSEGHAWIRKELTSQTVTEILRADLRLA